MDAGLDGNIGDKAVAECEEALLTDNDGAGFGECAGKQSAEDEHSGEGHNECGNAEAGDCKTLIQAYDQTDEQDDRNCQPLIQPVALGAGFTCSWTRADAEEHLYSAYGGTLTDNETEFGWYARISLPVIKREKFSVGFHVAWEQLWTLPKRSNMLSAGVTLERSIW